MNELGLSDNFDAAIEFLPPHHADEDESISCACCRRLQPRVLMDEDGCGICDDCLAP